MRCQCWVHVDGRYQDEASPAAAIQAVPNQPPGGWAEKWSSPRQLV